MRARRAGPGGCACVIALLLVTLALFRYALFSKAPVVLGNFLNIDLAYAFYPWRHFGFEALRRGALPLWNPLILCGCPFVANWQSAMLYPPNLMFLFLPVHTALNWSFTLHVFLAGLFTYLFMRSVAASRFGSLVSALTFMLSAPLIMRIFAGHVTMVCALPWFSAQLLAVEEGLRRRRAYPWILGGAALGLQVLAGHPQTVGYSIAGVMFYAVLRAFSTERDGGPRCSVPAACGYLLLLLSVGFSLGAAQILPGLEFVRISSRGSALDIREAASNSLPPENALTYLVPNAMGDSVRAFCWGRSYQWEAAVYVGILPLACAVLALCAVRNRYVCIFSVIAAGAYVLALGGYTPIFGLLYHSLPGFGLMRGSAKILFVPTFCLAALAGFGASALAGDEGGRGRCLRGVLWGTGGLFVLVLVVYLFGVAPGSEQSVVWKMLLSFRKGVDRDYWRILDNHLFIPLAYDVFRGGVVRLCALLAMATAVLALCAAGTRARRCAKPLIIALVAADLWSFDAPFLVSAPVSSCRWPADVVGFFEKDTSLFRIWKDARTASVGVNQGMNDGFFTADGYESAQVNAFRELVAAAGLDAEHIGEAMASTALSPLLAMMNLKYFVVPGNARVGGDEYALRFDNGQARIYEKRTVLPRAYLVHCARVIGNLRGVLAHLTGGQFDPRTEVVLDAQPEIPLPAGGAARRGEEAWIVRYAPDEVVVMCRLEEAGILFLGDVWFPGWEVSVDGLPGRIHQANYAFRGVALARGTHRVVFRYRPASFRYGAVVSIAALALVAAALAAAARRNPTAERRDARGSAPRR